MSRSIKQVISVIGILILSVWGFLKYSDFDRSPGVPSQGALSQSLQTTEEQPQLHRQHKTSEQIEEQSISEKSIAYHKVMEWRTAHFGDLYILKETRDAYDYDFKTLETLTEQGDFVAMHVLAAKYLEAHDGENAIRVYRIAAAYGSTHALRMLALVLHSTSADIDKRRKALLSRLAYYQVAFARGDKSFVIETDSAFEQDNIVLTDAEIRSVHDKASAIYLGLAAKREKLGLPAFDNSVPEYVEDYYSDAYGELVETYTTGDTPLFMSNN